MTEEEWLTEWGSSRMLEFLRDSGKTMDRKVQLWASACVRTIWPMLSDDGSRNAVEVAERVADGMASEDERKSAFEAVYQ